MRRFSLAAAIVLSVLTLAAGPSPELAVAQGRDQPRLTTLMMIVGNPLGPGGQLDSSEGREAVNHAINTLIVFNFDWPHEPGRPPDFGAEFNCLSMSPEGHPLGFFSVTGKGVTDKTLAWAREQLEEALLEIHRLRMGPLEHKAALAQDRVEQAENVVEALASELQALQETARAEGQALEPEDPQLLASVRRDNLSLRAELAGLNAQRQAIVEQIAVAKDELGATDEDQQLILRGLQRVLELRREELARVVSLQNAGQAPRTEVTRANVAVAQAEADLADRKRTLAQQAGGGQLGRLNERLVETQIAITAAQARLEETQKAIEQLERSSYNPASPLVIAYQRTRRALDGAQAEQEAATAELARVKMARDAIVAPKVTVIRREADQK